MKGIKDLIKQEDNATVGIGTLIVFIAMILVAAIAATILINTSNSLQVQAQRTGSDTIGEVSVGVNILDICGQHTTRVINGTSYSRIHNMTILITPRAGSKEIDLSETLIIITDGTEEYVLRTNQTLPVFANSSDDGYVFSKTTQSHPQLSTVFDLPTGEFGIIVVKDPDNTCTEDMPGINRGDKVMLTINLSAHFNGISERTHIWGRIVPEEGAPGVFDFRTPSGLYDTIIDLM